MDAFAASRKQRALDVQRAVNDTFYRSSIVAKSYPKEGLDAQETVTLLKYQKHIVARDVLDLGVGAGRTTRVLAGLARTYQGIDYSPVAIAHIRKALPHVRVHLDDMRDLGRFDDDCMDFVFAPNNVLDAVSHEDRERTLKEARRVLRKGGLVAFASHNRCYFDAKAGPKLRRSRNPVTFALHLLRYAAAMRTHLRMKELRRFEDDYALIDDSRPAFALLHYFVDRNAQQRQLERLGLHVVDVLDRAGETVPKGEMSPQSSCLMYIARKAA